MKINKYSIIILLNLFFSVVSHAANSTDVIPPSITPEGLNGYVLSYGRIQTYCNTADSDSNWGNCFFDPANAHCRTGYTPRFLVAETYNYATDSCALRGYYITPGALVDNGHGGYRIGFGDAYANFVSCPDRNITLNYAVLCVK